MQGAWRDSILPVTLTCLDSTHTAGNSLVAVSQRAIMDIQDNKKLEAKIDELLAQKVSDLADRRQLAKSLFKEIEQLTDDLDSRRRIYTKFQHLFYPEELPELTLRQILTKGWNFNSMASFRSLVTLDTFRRKAGRCYSAWPLNDKSNAVKFTDMLKVERPKVYTDAISLDSLKVTDYPSIIKPLHASTSQGVIIALSPEVFKVVRNGVFYSSFSEVKDHLAALLKSKKVHKDIWQVEELIAETANGKVRPAVDLKFYCFYGKVGQVLEVEREKGAKFRTRYPDGSLAKGAAFEESDDFPLTEITPDNVALAERISSEIPVPFLSIDFLKADNRLVFCEFTPRPGVYGKYKDDFDAYLGHLFLNAEARLQKDLVDGKNFSIYKSYLESLKK